MPVAVLVAATDTPEITPPLGSVTVPVMIPRSLCPNSAHDIRPPIPLLFGLSELREPVQLGLLVFRPSELSIGLGQEVVGHGLVRVQLVDSLQLDDRALEVAGLNQRPAQVAIGLSEVRLL